MKRLRHACAKTVYVEKEEQKEEDRNLGKCNMLSNSSIDANSGHIIGKKVPDPRISRGGTPEPKRSLKMLMRFYITFFNIYFFVILLDITLLNV